MITTDLLSIGNTFWSGMANHLWQSTLFAVAAWLITLFMKKNRARIRYWIWFTVSIKFLIPFSLIVNLGGLIAPEWMKAPVEIIPQLNVIQTINQPFTPPEMMEASPALDAAETQSPPNKTPWIILSLWLCGSLSVLLNWYKQTMRVSGIVRKAELLEDAHTLKRFHRIKLENRIFHTVQLVSTRDTMEPGVFGIFRPVIMLPAGILNHINDSELETILLHEFAHIQHKDNLTAFIHMLVEAFFWFHPFVWLTGSRLISERELACDESVLRSGKNPRAYAEGILKVCEYYFMSPLPCVSGVIGSNLKTRISGIMKKQTGHDLSPAKILFLSLAGLSVLCIPLAIGMINTPPSQAHNASKSKMPIDPVRDNIGADTDEISAAEQNLSEKPLDENNSPVIAKAPAGTQTAATTEKETDSLKTVRESVLNTDTAKSVLLAQKQAPLKVSSDASNSGIRLKTGDSAGDRNREIADSEEAETIPEKYDLDNDYKAVDRITLFDIKSFENIDKQSLILRTSYSDYYLLVLRRPRFEVSYGKTNFDFHGSTIIAGHDRVVMDYHSGPQYYTIEKIYKLEGGTQVTEIKERLRKDQK